MTTTIEACGFDRNLSRKGPRSKLVKVTVTHSVFTHERDDINGAVSPYDEIQSLEIKNSQFRAMPLNLLENCQLLTHLTINSTNLSDFGFESVKNCRMLQFIDLSNNRIEEPNVSLLDLKFLEFLSYGNNRISRISLEFIEGVERSSLKLLNFILNPIISELFMTSAQEIARLLRNFYYYNFATNYTRDHAEESMQLLRASGLKSDFKILTKDKMFDVHTCILAARSKVLKRIVKLNEKSEFKVENYPTDAFEAFLEFIYDGTAPRNTENLIDIYNIANQFDVSELRKFCEFMIVEKFCERNSSA